MSEIRTIRNPSTNWFSDVHCIRLTKRRSFADIILRASNILARKWIFLLNNNFSSDVVTDLPMDASSVYVRIPQPKTNMNWYDFVKATPTWAKKLEKEMAIGRTQVLSVTY